MDATLTNRSGAAPFAQGDAQADYFAVFGLPRKLNVDTAALERDFYRMSRKLHPDVYARSSAQEQEWATQASSQLNDAYRTLRDPIERTKYLLELEGVQLEEQSKAATDAARQSGVEKKQAVPPELLEEVFELNMQLQEHRMNREMSEADENLARELKETQERLEERMRESETELKSLWNQWDAVISQEQPVAGLREKVRDAMVQLLNRRNYLRNLVRDIGEALEV